MCSDTRSIIDPFVEVEIIGLPVDCCKDQTRVVDDNGKVAVSVHPLRVCAAAAVCSDRDKCSV